MIHKLKACSTFQCFESFFMSLMPLDEFMKPIFSLLVMRCEGIETRCNLLARGSEDTGPIGHEIVCMRLYW